MTSVGAAAVRGIEGHGLEQPFHDGVQAARADVLGAFVDLERHLGEPLHAGLLEFQISTPSVASSAEYWRHSEASGSVRIRTKSCTTKRLELDADGQAALQLGNQVRGLGHVKCARCDEQHVIGLDRAVLGVDRAALDQRQQVALHALARHVGAGGLLAAGDLVDFVDEDDAVLLGIFHGAQLQLLFVDHFRGFLVDQQLQRLLDLQLALSGFGRRPDSETCPAAAASSPPCRGAP